MPEAKGFLLLHCTRWRRPVVQICFLINIYQFFVVQTNLILVYKINKAVNDYSLEILKYLSPKNWHFIQINFIDDTEQGIRKTVPFTWFFLWLHVAIY